MRTLGHRQLELLNALSDGKWHSLQEVAYKVAPPVPFGGVSMKWGYTYVYRAEKMGWVKKKLNPKNKFGAKLVSLTPLGLKILEQGFVD